jgi:hypothetical protein
MANGGYQGRGEALGYDAASLTVKGIGFTSLPKRITLSTNLYLYLIIVIIIIIIIIIIRDVRFSWFIRPTFF